MDLFHGDIYLFKLERLDSGARTYNHQVSAILNIDFFKIKMLPAHAIRGPQRG